MSNLRLAGVLRPWPVVVTTCLLATGVAHGRNYLIIVADDLGSDKVGSYQGDWPGYTPTHMPVTTTIDDLAANGLRFTRVWAEPACSPTRATLHTGQHPFRHGVGWPLTPRQEGLDVAAFTTLADFASANGYGTGAFGKWHIGTLDANGDVGTPPAGDLDFAPHPATAGFDRFYGKLDGDIDDYSAWTRVEWRGGAADGSVKNPVETEATVKTAEVAGSWISKETGDWLAVVNFHAPHAPTAADDWTLADYDPACTRGADPTACAPADTECIEETVYAALVECMDLQIEALLTDMDTGVLENTLIVFMGDNGTPTDVQESVFEDADGDGIVDERGKMSAFETGLRVPFIVTDGYEYVHGSGGSITSPGRDVLYGGHIADVYETIHQDMTGTTSGSPDSFDLSACFTNTGDYCGSSRRFAYSELYDASVDDFGALRYGDDKMVVTVDVANNCLEKEFFDTAADPFELTPTTFGATRTARLVDLFERFHFGNGTWADVGGWC